MSNFDIRAHHRHEGDLGEDEQRPSLRKFTSIGSYPIMYLTERDEPLCGSCAYEARQEGEELTAWPNYASSIECDCGETIEAADEEDEPTEEEPVVVFNPDFSLEDFHPDYKGE